uniref:Uncharacterized protein n=1 Tax=viral metagenome TaxID=1070528 RepID=A0A6H1ZZW3_9ZZZZ
MKGTFEECQRIEREHVCGICSQPLITRGTPTPGVWAVLCLQHPDSDQFIRPLSVPQALKRHDHKELRRHGYTEEAITQMEEIMEEKGRTTEDRLPAIFEATTNEIVKGELQIAALQWAETAGLRPELQHVCLYFGRPMPTINGWHYLFRRIHPHGTIGAAPLNEKERGIAGIPETVEAWEANTFDANGNHLTVGHGYANRDNKTQLYKGVSEQWGLAWDRAEKRAEEDALRKAVPLGLEKEETDVDRG